MQPEKIRQRSVAALKKLGFKVAATLPLANQRELGVGVELRAVDEIAARLMALDAVFTWVVFPEQAAAAERVKAYIQRNSLDVVMTKEEKKIVKLSRPKAQEKHVETIGWKLENMWPLAWVLGYEDKPPIGVSMIPEEVSKSIIRDFLPGLDATIDDLLDKAERRTDEEVVELEDLFYCAHNAVRSAQMGEATVPKGFHPILHGGVIHERRHALTWCLSPEIAWDDADLST